MNPLLKNIFAVIVGWFGGSIVNMGIVMIGSQVFPEFDLNNITTFEPKHFIFPFLAHAFGTLVGAFIAYKIAATHKMKFALGIGAFFLIGGIIVSQMIPAPTWFTITDLALAYIPMACIGGKLAAK